MVNLPTIDMTGTGQNINRLRKQAGLSVRELQDIFGFATPQAIYKWQQGVALPAIDNLVVLAALCRPSLKEVVRQLSSPMRYLPLPCSSFVLMNRKYKKSLSFLEKRIYNKATTNMCKVERRFL